MFTRFNPLTVNGVPPMLKAQRAQEIIQKVESISYMKLSFALAPAHAATTITGVAQLNRLHRAQFFLPSPPDY